MWKRTSGRKKDHRGLKINPAAADKAVPILTSVTGEKEGLSALLNSIQDEVWFANKDKRLTLVNRAGREEFGLDASQTEDVENVAARYEVYRPDGTPRPVDEAPPLRALRGEIVLNQEEIVRTPATGELRHRQVNAAPVKDSDGNIVGSVSVVRDITEHKRAEEALRVSEEQFRAFVIASSDAVYRMSPDWREMRQLKGREFIPDTDRPNRSWLEKYIHPEDQPQVLNAISESIRSRGIFELEHRVIRVDGTLGWTLSRAVPLLNDIGEISEWFGTARDITKRKQAEDALRQLNEQLESRVTERTAELARTAQKVQAERQRFNEMMGYMPVYVILLSPDYHVPFANRFFEERFGKSNGERCYEYLFHRAEPCENCESFKALKTNAPHRWEWLGPDGRNYDIYDFPFTDVDGSQLIMEVGLDITDRKNATTKVLAERQRLFDVLETLPVMICLLTPTHHIAFANRSFREMFGEPQGRHCYETCFGFTEPCNFCESYRVLTTGQSHHWEVTMKKGSVIDVFDIPFTDIDGSPLILEMDIDVTERRLAERELLQVHEDLAMQANQLRTLAGELTLSEQRERSRLAKLLHDHLQQLLVAAKFRTTVLGRGGEESVRQAAKEVEELIDESIAASRNLTAELSPPILQEAGLTAGLQWLARRMTNTQGLLVEIEAEEDGDLPEDIKVLLFESVRELLFNVAKHARTRSAAVNMRRIGDRLQLIVSDQGVGFDPTTMPNAGEGGRGFGLLRIKERLEFMRGRLEIDSNPGQGSRFVLSVPVTPSTAGTLTPQEVPGVSNAHPMEAKPPDPRRKIRVIIADDHAMVREGIANLLADEPDIEIVAEAADGREAVDLAGKLLPDVILMDMSMPKLNGIEATRAICSEFPIIRIIGLSMFDDSERAEAMRDAGAVDYVTKTGPANTLINAIRSSVRTSD